MLTRTIVTRDSLGAVPRCAAQGDKARDGLHALNKNWFHPETGCCIFRSAAEHFPVSLTRHGLGGFKPVPVIFNQHRPGLANRLTGGHNVVRQSKSIM